MHKIYLIIYRLGVILLSIILFIYALVQARTLLYPLVLAVLFSYLLYPIGKWLERRGFHRILANFIIIIGTFIFVSSVIYIIYSQVGLLAEELPELRHQAEHNVNRITESISSTIGVSTTEFKDWINAQLNSLSENSDLLFNTIFPSTATTLMAIGLMPVYIFLLLYYRNKLVDFIMMIWPEERKASVRKVIYEISYVTKHYMGGVFTVVLILCFINSLGLLIVGVRFAILLGIISAICNFIPYFGTLIGALFPLAMAVFTGQSPGETVGVIILFLIVQFTENNILTPNITGGSVQVNPLVTIISIIAGGMVWGIPGMFVVIPLLGMLKIVLESTPSTRPIAFLLGTNGTEKHAITFRKIKGYFYFRKNQNSWKEK